MFLEQVCEVGVPAPSAGPLPGSRSFSRCCRCCVKRPNLPSLIPGPHVKFRASWQPAVGGCPGRFRAEAIASYALRRRCCPLVLGEAPSVPCPVAQRPPAAARRLPHVPPPRRGPDRARPAVAARGTLAPIAEAHEINTDSWVAALSAVAFSSVGDLFGGDGRPFRWNGYRRMSGQRSAASRSAPRRRTRPSWNTGSGTRSVR